MGAINPAVPGMSRRSAFEQLHRFLDWWGDGLRLAVPAHLRQRWFWPSARLWWLADGVQLQARVGDEAAFAERAQGVDAAVALARHPDLPRWLLLPAALAVRAPITLPQAAAAHLRQAARYEIDRQTPFAADEVAFDVRALGIDAASKTVRAELVVAPEARLAPLRAQLQAAGIALQGVDVADAEGRPLGVNLLPAAQRMQPVNRWRQRNLLLACLALGLVAVGAVGSVQRERAHANALDAALERDRALARQVAGQRQRLTDLVEAAHRVETLRARRAPLATILNVLAERLPGNTYVERLSIEGEQMQLSGLSPQSTRLTPALQGSPLWRDVAMSGAVVADAGRGGERYTLSMRLAAATRPEAAR